MEGVGWDGRTALAERGSRMPVGPWWLFLELRAVSVMLQCEFVSTLRRTRTLRLSFSRLSLSQNQIVNFFHRPCFGAVLASILSGSSARWSSPSLMGVVIMNDLDLEYACICAKRRNFTICIRSVAHVASKYGVRTMRQYDDTNQRNATIKGDKPSFCSLPSPGGPPPSFRPSTR